MIIYKITNKLNNKAYIGQTKRALDERMYEHIRKGNKPIDVAIRELGIDCFDVEIVDTADTAEELDRKEQEWIAKCNSMLPNGYNQTIGGRTTTGFKHREESKASMSRAKSAMYIGENNPFYGKHHSEETRKRWSKQRSGRKLTPEWKAKIGKACQKKVVNLDTGEIFDSLKEAAEKYGIPATHITRVCKGRRKKTGGYRWQYYEA